MQSSKLELAAQQFIGFLCATKGYSIRQLADEMGLQFDEWEILKKEINLKLSDVQELDDYFKSITKE